MAGIPTKEELANLDKQALIDMLTTANASLQALEKEMGDIRVTNALLMEEVASLRAKRFGRSTEARLSSQVEGQMELDLGTAFNEAEKTAEDAPSTEEPGAEEVVKNYKRRNRTGKREEDLKGIAKEVVPHELTEEELLAHFPDGKYKRLPDEVYSRLEFYPATFKVFEHHVAVYVGCDDQTFVRAERPASLLRSSILTPSLAAGIINWKYVNSSKRQITR